MLSMRVRLNTTKSSVLGALGGLLVIGGCSAALLVPYEYGRFVLSATLCLTAPIWFCGIAAQRNVVVNFAPIPERERKAFLFWNTISLIIGLMGFGAFVACLIAKSFDERVAVGLFALLIAALGFYFFWKTTNRHGALLVANMDKVR